MDSHPTNFLLGHPVAATVLLLVVLAGVGLTLRLLRLQREHRVQRDRLSLVLDGSPALTYMLAPDTLAPSYVSGNVSRLLGVEAAALIGDGQWWRSRLHPGDRDAAVSRFERWWAEGGQPPLTHSYRLLGPGNRPIWVEDTVRVQRDAQGRALAVIGAMADVTERRELGQRLTQLTENVPGLIYQLQLGPGTLPLRMPFVGEAGLRAFGLLPADVVQDARPLLERVLSEDMPALTDSIQASARDLAPWHHQFRIRHTSLGLRWVSGHAQPERLDDGSTLWHGVLNDVTERKLAEHALAENERQMRALIGSMDDMVLVVDAQGVVRRFHQPPRLQAVTGVSTSVVGRPAADVLPVPMMEAMAQAMLSLQVGGGPVRAEVAWPGPQGDFWLDATFSVVEDEQRRDRARLSCLCVASDMSERKRREEELTALATTDALTHLPNRRHFLSRLEEELGRVHRYPDEEIALLMLDLDHFKRINDTWGHNAGDLVLQAFADVLRQTPRAADLPGRVGGEEFALLLPNTGREAAMALAERVRLQVQALEVAQPDGPAMQITVSIGCTRLLPGDSVESALGRADQALYDAKHAGRNRVMADWPSPPI